MTEKQARKELMRRATELTSTVHVGKDGIDEGLLNEITSQLKKHRLIKIKVLSNTDMSTSDTADQISEATNSVVVAVGGGVIILTDKRTWDSQSQKKY